MARAFVRAAFARPLSVFAFLGLTACLTACGGASAGGDTAEAPAPKPRNAAEIAQAVAGGKVGVLVYADRARNHPVGARVAALNVWQPVLEGTGIDPLRDLERAYVAAPSVRSEEGAVVVAQHSLPPERIEGALNTLIARSTPSGQWLADASVPTAQVTVRGKTRAIAMVEPSFLIILPVARARDASRFAGTGGFPDPEGDEAAIATAMEPSRSLKVPGGPRLPDTIRSARALITLTPDGGARVASTAQSASEAQASADAAELTRAIDDATSFKVAFVKIRFFGPVLFRSEGDQVKTTVDLTPADLDKLFGLLSAVLPR